ncbi:hypothetical protein [Mesoterricola silvestris]|uniref:Uncharacterized protein n=1 Tax=Mesoterricola silvestris TaxID=2927979 RepID=A0AA48H6X4_9BACT|nr:hypothetical protein [Mesoterricola silvestris]BDU72933.1 hypothetical protein METEAL_21070 [Mesoterricola silvestris]
MNDRRKVPYAWLPRVIGKERRTRRLERRQHTGRLRILWIDLAEFVALIFRNPATPERTK